jgi:hypothetical protein
VLGFVPGIDTQYRRWRRRRVYQLWNYIRNDENPAATKKFLARNDSGLNRDYDQKKLLEDY